VNESQHPQFSLSGKIALITGAGSSTGIGFAIATLLADLNDAATVTALVDEVQADVGAIDLLVNNAGMLQEGGNENFTPLAEIEDADWHAGITRNLTTCYLVTRRVLPNMLARRRRRIINASTVTGPLVATPGEAAYSAAKAGMVGMNRAPALEVATQGITVNCVAPGWIAKGSRTSEESLTAQHTPTGSGGTPAEMATVIAFVAMPGASHITGQMVVIDGGNCLQEHKG
jgi:3-oxoacyl-[acyl-carrier protein] reductase